MLRLPHWFAAFLFCVLLTSNIVAAQTPPATPTPEPVIEVKKSAPPDTKIQSRMEDILAEIEPLTGVEVNVNEGVLVLTGETANEAQAQQALRLAKRLEGVVTVEDKIERTLDVRGNVIPAVEKFKAASFKLLNALPLLGVAFLLVLFFTGTGIFLSRRRKLLRLLAPNAFLAEFLGQAVIGVFFVTGIVMALKLLGASALITTVLGGAGVVGLAVGFAVRDSVENYIASIMLSLRQPFRAKDHVVINDQEGIVVRLTSRATILMTMDGNHLRIPNASVFKGIILNYTTNPERRLVFDLGIGSSDNPVAAIQTALDEMEKSDFILKSPEPSGIIKDVGDSTIIIRFMAWINQTHTNFGKARSLTIYSVMEALGDNDFTMPEPSYRLRFDRNIYTALENGFTKAGKVLPKVKKKDVESDTSDESEIVIDEDILDVSPDRHLEDKINKERSATQESDLLDQERPKE